MSLWLRDRLRIWISPTRVVAASGQGLLNRSSSLRTLFDEPLAATDGHADKAAQVLQVIERQMSGIGRRSRIDVALSDHFVRYLALPWRDGLGYADWETYAQHEFERVYGRSVSPRRVRIAAARSGKTRVAAAIDGALIEGLQAVASSARARIGVVESNLCRIANRYGGQMTREGHLFVAEPGRLTRLLLAERSWSDVQSVRCGPAVGAALARMLRELKCASGANPGDAAAIWYWGYAQADELRTAVGAGHLEVLPVPPSLPPHCSTMGML